MHHGTNLLVHNKWECSHTTDFFLRSTVRKLKPNASWEVRVVAKPASVLFTREPGPQGPQRPHTGSVRLPYIVCPLIIPGLIHHYMAGKPSGTGRSLRTKDTASSSKGLACAVILHLIDGCMLINVTATPSSWVWGLDVWDDPEDRRTFRLTARESWFKCAFWCSQHREQEREIISLLFRESWPVLGCINLYLYIVMHVHTLSKHAHARVDNWLFSLLKIEVRIASLKIALWSRRWYNRNSMHLSFSAYCWRPLNLIGAARSVWFSWYRYSLTRK